MSKTDPYHSDWEAMGLQHYGAQPAPAPKPMTSEEKNRIAMREKYRLSRHQGQQIKLPGSLPMRTNAEGVQAYSRAGK
ncbi:MAG: hypothetical protein LAD29_10565 [Rhodoferax sp.]|nr:hypothetical protein [Rhodoferax sp.]